MSPYGVPPQTLACPECTGAMELWALGPVDVDRCTECGGIWFDKGEMARAIQQFDPGHPPSRSTRAPPRTLPTLLCPRCSPQQVLEAYLWKAQAAFSRCHGCFGIYIQESVLSTMGEAIASLKRPKNRLTLGEIGTLIAEIATAGFG